MSVSRNCAVHRVTLSLRERERATSDRRTLMLISASNSKNDVNKFNVSAIVVREERRRGEETSKRQMPQKCCDERPTDRTAIGSRMQMKIFTNENAVTVEFEKEERGGRKLQCLPIFSVLVLLSSSSRELHTRAPGSNRPRLRGRLFERWQVSRLSRASALQVI